MAARIDNGRVQLLTRTGLDWSEKYPSAVAALANLKVKIAYLDGELCGINDAGLPSFAHTQAATDGERRARLVYYAFDLLHLEGRDCLDTYSDRAQNAPRAAHRGNLGLQFNGHEPGDGALTASAILEGAAELSFVPLLNSVYIGLRDDKPVTDVRREASTTG